MPPLAELDLSRPSSLLLVAVIAVNLLLPVAHFWPGDAQAAALIGEAPADRTATSRSATSGGDETASDGSGAAAPPPVAGSEAPSAAGTAVILPVELVQVPAYARRVPAVPPAAPVCRAWGPFAEAQEARAMAARLALDGDFRVFESEEADSPDYLVTLLVPGGRAAVGETVQRLETHEVDSYLLDREGAVLAAGVFSARARAESRSRQLAELGFEATVEPLSRTRRSYHLLARVPRQHRAEIPPIGACGDIAPPSQFL